ncbi:MAG: YdiU family protein [Betaproteobacteria bacterium]|nr:YdiU family protein [Betaproteobacteria bacterium]
MDTPIPFDNSYARDLAGFYVPHQPETVPEPRLLYLNLDLAKELGLDLAPLGADALAAIFSGNRLPPGAEPIAQAYAGHQFGQFSPQLGDGRALLIGEIIDRQGRRHDMALKGSGRTPFSRNGDGKAAVGPMLREVLIGEAMHALGIPTTRALAVVASGEPVYRERPLPGAILTRVAASHLRVGTFEFFSAHTGPDRVRQLADYTIARHYPELARADHPYLELLRAVAEAQAALIACWMQVGFVHGVMNTDNMSLAGETIDYGPCAFMEVYDPGAVFSSIDRNGRYAYDQQPKIARWNLARFAETLLPLLAADTEQAVALATEVIDAFPQRYRQHWLTGMGAKLGLAGSADEATENADAALIGDWLELLQTQGVDYTLAWRRLAEAAEGRAEALFSLFAEPEPLTAWLTRWQARCAAEDRQCGGDALLAAGAARAARMRQLNPWLIPRNHRVEEALAAASDDGDLRPFEQLLDALKQPYMERPGLARYAEPASAAFMANFCTYCGT